jgi:hypothetical protein
MATCLFCDIAQSSTDRHVLSEPHAAAFLDRSPLLFGHVLVVPTAHAEALHDLSDADVGPFFATVKRIARAVELAMEAKGTFVAMNNKVRGSGSPGALPPRGPHGSGHARLAHPALRNTASLRGARGARLQQWQTLQQPRHRRPGETTLRAPAQPAPPLDLSAIPQRRASGHVASAAKVAVVTS